MKKRFRRGLLLGAGVGYVLGTKAGRERYEQLRRLYDNLLDSQGFRQASDKVKGAAGTGFEQARDRASEGFQKVQETVREKRTDSGSSSLSVAPPPSSN